MFERTDRLDEYEWTARRFEILPAKIHPKTGVLQFVDPVVQSIRRSGDRYAERWYWSWWKKPETNLFCRLYFLARPKDHSKIWETVEDLRQGKFDDSIRRGTQEGGWRELSDDVLEWGVALEHASEMSLMIWKGIYPGSDDRYGKTFHHLFEPLAIPDGKALEILHRFIGFLN